MLIPQPDNTTCDIAPNTPLLDLPGGKLVKNTPAIVTNHQYIGDTDDGKWALILAVNPDHFLGFAASTAVSNKVTAIPTDPYEAFIQDVYTRVKALVAKDFPPA